MPHTLLLADDSVTIQRVIELTFADEDVRVVAVSNGDEAIAVLDRTPPDIVLADVAMPGASGYEVAQHVKGTPHLAHIPVVLLTGAFEPVDQARAEAAGCDGVLAKPFEPQLVIGRVKELLARGQQGPASPGALPPPTLAPSWSSPFADPAPAGEAAKAPPSAGGSDYFDRLDQAFANLSSAKPSETAGPAAPIADIDWFGSKGAPADAPVVSDRWDVPSGPNAPDLPLSYNPPQPEFDRVGGLGASPFSAPAPHPPASSATLPPLADAFAALLAAEQSAPAPSGAPAWPGAPAPGGVTADLVEQVTRRVLEQLTDRVVRETVADIVSSVAERLVRQEIERIKNSIK